MSNAPAGEPSWNYTAYVVAVLDVQGQRQAMRDLPPHDDSPERQEQIKSLLRKSLGVREQVFETFLTSINSFNTQFDEAKLAQLAPEVRAEFVKIRTFKSKTYRISDTLITYFPIRSDGLLNSYDLLATFTALMHTMLVSNASKIPVRGGVELGWGINWHDAELYGPAFLDAYDLEEKRAEYPRVVLGKELSEYVDFLSSSPSADRRAHFENQMAGQVRSMICVDDDSAPMVDYLGQTAADLTKKGSIYGVNLFEEGKKFAEVERDRFAGEGNEKLRARYERLAKYYAKSEQFWRT